MQYIVENYKENINVSYSTNELISSSDLEKEFVTYLKQIKDSSIERIAVLKNNKVEAVIISKDDYETMKEALKEVEARKILTSIQAGLEDIKTKDTKPIDSLWNELDD